MRQRLAGDQSDLSLAKFRGRSTESGPRFVNPAHLIPPAPFVRRGLLHLSSHVGVGVKREAVL